MQLLTATIVFTLLLIITSAQTMEKESIEHRVAAIEDKMAIKNVVDEFSNLAADH